MVRVHSGLPFLAVCDQHPAITSPVILTVTRKSMTADEAKELLIDRMNYMAYRETDHSLWDSDKNRLFGAEHYVSGRPVLQPSVWGEGEEFEGKMAELFRWAFLLSPPSHRYKEAIQTLKSGDHYLNRIISLAGF